MSDPNPDPDPDLDPHPHPHPHPHPNPDPDPNQAAVANLAELKLRPAEDALLVLDNNGRRGEEVSYGPYFNASEAQAAVRTVLSGGKPARAATPVETNVAARVSAPCWQVDRAHDYCL